MLRFLKIWDWQGFWRRRGVANYLLLPLSLVFYGAVVLRRAVYRQFPPARVGNVPVVVVGNVTVGGAGKTPFVIALVLALQRAGYKPAVVSRGYGRQDRQGSAAAGGGESAALVAVDAANAAQAYGDEPLLIAQKTQVPVCVARRRALAMQHLHASAHEFDVIISDDGLQHYAMHRDIEIGLINGRYGNDGSTGSAGFGNGWLLPAGALREPPARLQECALRVVLNGQSPLADYAIAEETAGFYFLSDVDKPVTPITAADFVGKRVVAVCGLAHPQAFFERLTAMGISLAATHALADHARLSDSELQAIAADIILMTEKDAVKYAEASSTARICVLAIRYTLPEALINTLTEHLENLKH